METKHTPGPWYEATTGNHQGLIIAEETGKSIAVIYDKKDAQLIAAAPDLLEACADILTQLRQADDEWFTEHCEGFDTSKVEAAIQKATGGDL